MKIEITLNQEQLNQIRNLLNVENTVSNTELVEMFIIENTCIDKDGNEF